MPSAGILHSSQIGRAAPLFRSCSGTDVQSSTMQNACINLTDTARCVHLFQIDAFTATKEKLKGSIASTRTRVGGYDWVIDYHPAVCYSDEYWIKFRVTLASDASSVVMSFACRLVDQAGELGPSQVPAMSATLGKGQARDYFVMSRNELASSGYVKDDSFLVECVITVLINKAKEGAAGAGAAANVAPPSAAGPSTDLHKHFGELLRSQKGTDITFLVSGETVAAHKCVLAARSPVFMAELFGDMKEKTSQRVEIEDMKAEVFRALIQFIYTDTVPDMDNQEEDTKTMAQHLLAAADRYGMDRLKFICEDKVCGDIRVGTAAIALILAEQHGCPKLKTRCMESIVATPANLRAVVATEGYKHLMASCPSVLSDLLVAVVERYK